MKTLIYPILVMVSPFIVWFIKFQAIIRPNNPFIQFQNHLCSYAERLLESTPQMILQLLIMLSSYQTSTKQWISIAFSAISLSIQNVDVYFENYSLTLLQKILNSTTLMSSAIFRVMSFGSYIALFSIFEAVAGVAGYWAVSGFISLLLYLFVLFEEADAVTQLLELTFLGFITMTNLADTTASKLARFITFYGTTVLYLIYIYSFIIVSYTSPTLILVDHQTSVLDINLFRKYVWVTFGFGLVSIVSDIFTGVFHIGKSYLKCKFQKAILKERRAIKAISIIVFGFILLGLVLFAAVELSYVACSEGLCQLS